MNALKKMRLKRRLSQEDIAKKMGTATVICRLLTSN